MVTWWDLTLVPVQKTTTYQTKSRINHWREKNWSNKNKEFCCLAFRDTQGLKILICWRNYKSNKLLLQETNREQFWCWFNTLLTFSFSTVDTIFNHRAEWGGGRHYLFIKLSRAQFTYSKGLDYRSLQRKCVIWRKWVERFASFYFLPVKSWETNSGIMKMKAFSSKWNEF